MPRTFGHFPGRKRIALAAACSLLGVGLLALGAQAASKTYVWYDKDGRPHYTDRPQTGSEEVVLAPAQTYAAPAQASSSSKPANTPTGAAAPGLACRIISPTPEEVILNQPSVTVSAQGPQRATAVLRLNGATINSVDGQPVFKVTPIPRGTYTATVLFTGMTGATVCQTAPVTFYVRQPSLIKPAAPPPKPAPART
jgi:hypothetical protein